MRPSTGFGLFWLAVLAGFAVITAAHGSWGRALPAPRILTQKNLVRRLNLTDLAWFTEGRCVRHPSQADRHAAFEDHPLSLGTLPASGIVTPSPSVRMP